MKVSEILIKSFEKMPEWPIKNNIRAFLAFNKIIPSFISNSSPIKGYELYYKVKKGDVIVDAGAFPGDYTIFAAKKVGKKGKIIAFEPDKKNREILKKNLMYEKLNNVIIVPKGLWNANTKLKSTPQKGLHSSLLLKGKGKEVDVIKLDDELKTLGVGKVDVLKMDIEGAEIQAIEGAKKTLSNNNLNVAIASYHIVNGKKTSFFLEKFLLKLGYNVKTDFHKHLTTYGWKKN